MYSRSSQQDLWRTCSICHKLRLVVYGTGSGISACSRTMLSWLVMRRCTQVVVRMGLPKMRRKGGEDPLGILEIDKAHIEKDS